MMSIRTIRPMLLATAFALAGCGGGGGGGYGVGSTPPPPVTPTPTPTPAAFVLIATATTSQQFAVAGAARLTTDDPTPHLGAADQLQARYVASSNSYEVQLPNSQTWIGLTGKSENEAAGGEVIVANQFLGYQYSALINWFVNGLSRGVESVGIATAAGSVPTTGSATFNGSALGTTSESTSSKLVSPFVQGSVTLSFDFAQGALSGNIRPVLDPEWHDYELGTFTFRDTVYSTGSTTFSGQFDTNLAGVNSFAGLFTGPNAQELIGNFAFPYQSPIDGLTYQAGGAFIAKK
jgi:C-lobe and N-lobe beta barrels of Tf-binding protein B